ncbi:transmembrane protein 248 [Nematostella vectensis]|nr:transmembrane protein 248 [Nematostella vectensis]
MFNCKCIKNLVGFANSRPPCVVFTACLAVFAVGLFSLGYYMQVGVFDEENTDWRMFIGSLAQKEFCMFSNNTLNSTLNYTVSENLTLSASLIPVTLPMILRVYPGNLFLGTVTNVSHVTTIVRGGELGLSGAMHSQPVNLTFKLEKHWSVSCEGVACPNSGFAACGVVSLPAEIIPADMPHNYCNVSYEPVSAMVEMTSVGSCSKSNVLVKTSVPRYLEDHTTEKWVDVGNNEWETVNLRLQYSSYFLFVMVITCILYGMIKGRPVKNSKKIGGQTI